ncbi:MAG: DUF4142 domain-containing protein, partial [Nitrososphaera sp.]|nr:DUF4142 domain-containing protein [Nitrososphaera sp.]
MKRFYVLATLAAVCLLSACDKFNDFFDHGNNGNTLNATDKMFMTKVAIGNTAEIQAGALAASKATDPAVKSFGQAMVVEHTQAQKDLKAVGAKVNFPVADTVDPAHKALIMTLSSLSGRAFDSAYIHSQVRDHEMTYAIFQQDLN